MTDFNFTLLVNDPPATILSAALGASNTTKLADADVGKGVKLAANQSYELVAKDDDIEGVVDSISPETVNDGFSFGGVQVDRRILAEIGASVTGTTAIGNLVVADTPVARGTKGILQVYVGTPTTHKWRVIRFVTGAGSTQGNTVLLEKV